MKKGLCLILLLVLVASFAVGSMHREAQAKVLDCWTFCGDGDVMWECCEVTRGCCIFLVRCRVLIPETPC